MKTFLKGAAGAFFVFLFFYIFILNFDNLKNIKTFFPSETIFILLMVYATCAISEVVYRFTPINKVNRLTFFLLFGVVVALILGFSFFDLNTAWDIRVLAIIMGALTYGIFSRLNLKSIPSNAIIAVPFVYTVIAIMPF